VTNAWILLPEAEEELRQAMRWYDERRAGLGTEFLGVVEAALNDITSAPQRWPAWEHDARYRRFVLRRFPYVVFYQVRGKTMEIVAVAHARREPGYWRSRTP